MRDKGDLARPRDPKLVDGTGATAGSAGEHNAVKSRRLGRCEAGNGYPEEEGCQGGRGNPCPAGCWHWWTPTAGPRTPCPSASQSASRDRSWGEVRPRRSRGFSRVAAPRTRPGQQHARFGGAAHGRLSTESMSRTYSANG